jgi:hypothetical protein
MQSVSASVIEVKVSVDECDVRGHDIFLEPLGTAKPLCVNNKRVKCMGSWSHRETVPVNDGDGVYVSEFASAQPFLGIGLQTTPPSTWQGLRHSFRARAVLY